MAIPNLALALGSSLTAGLNLYITILTLGLLDRFDLLNLPESLAPLSHTWVLIAAAVLLLIEVVADKVPYLDNAWDAVHTFIRIPAGAVLAALSFEGAPSHIVWIAALAGGFVSFTTHGAKATTRLAVNSTPEPFTNWFLSILEDVLSLAVLWLVSAHPYLAVAAALVLLAVFALVLVLFYRFFRLLFRRLRRSSLRPSTLESAKALH